MTRNRYILLKTRLARVTAIADKLGVEFALIHRHRNGLSSESDVDKMELLVGDVKGKVCIEIIFIRIY
jgi:phosphoribosylpyrophosphate synthetase